jgi:sulfite reductase (NADPH) flavoprotein alpha-component
MIDNPLSTEQSRQLNELLTSLNPNQKSWLGGYLTGLNESTRMFLGMLSDNKPSPTPNQNAISNQDIGLKVLYGTRSGNSLKVAKILSNHLQIKGLVAEIVNLNEYNPKNIKKEKNIFIVVSTDGEGEPPLSAEEFYNFLHSNKVAKLENLQYSVLALGDSKYQSFCKTGRDIDKRLCELGAKRITERIDCDVDFESPANQWIETAINKFIENNKSYITVNEFINTEEIVQKYSKQNPFSAKIMDKILLNGRKSTKETYHIEFSLEDSGMNFEPGDAVGIISQNSENLVDKILERLNFSGKEQVDLEENSKTIREALIKEYELSTLTPPVVEEYCKITSDKQLQNIVSQKDKLQSFIYGRDVLDMLTEYPFEMDLQPFLSILRKLQPRLYSIASSPDAFADEVHITVGIVRYLNNLRKHEGVCSSFLADKTDEGSVVPIYIDENISFRLPTDTNLPIIMIGAGTGIAPYRAFVQHRRNQNAQGKNWLFFGDRNFQTDFLYQSEWLKHLKDKSLTKMDVAFSRDQEKKIYVQHKLMEQKKQVFEWINEGAHLYVCGDKNTMGRDVKDTLLSIIKSESGYNDEKTAEYFKQLRKENRYHEDVY